MNKLTDLLSEGAFGPGSQAPVKLRNKSWKAQVGTVDNKRRPEAIYLIMSTWVKPKLSIIQANALGNMDPNDVVLDIAKGLDVDLKRMHSQLRAFFDTLYFVPDSIIFTYDFAATRAAPGKAQFLEIEINIDTVNDIDYDDKPAPNKLTGKIEHLHFDQFKGPTKKAAEKILQLPFFSRSAQVEFQKTKRK